MKVDVEKLARALADADSYSAREAWKIALAALEQLAAPREVMGSVEATLCWNNMHAREALATIEAVGNRTIGVEIVVKDEPEVPPCELCGRPAGSGRGRCRLTGDRGCKVVQGRNQVAAIRGREG